MQYLFEWHGSDPKTNLFLPISFSVSFVLLFFVCGWLVGCFEVLFSFVCMVVIFEQELPQTAHISNMLQYTDLPENADYPYLLEVKHKGV